MPESQLIVDNSGFRWCILSGKCPSEIFPRLVIRRRLRETVESGNIPVLDLKFQGRYLCLLHSTPTGQVHLCTLTVADHSSLKTKTPHGVF